MTDIDGAYEPTEGDKYVIFKREDWDNMLAALGYEGSEETSVNLPLPLKVVMDRAITDGTVIRRQDVYAPPALEMYAKCIGVSIETMNRILGQPNHLGLHLQRIADHFHGQAELAYQEHADGGGKLPD